MSAASPIPPIHGPSGGWSACAPCSASSCSPGSSAGNGCGGSYRPSSFQLDIPVKIVPPALVEIIGREASTMLLELPAGRAERAAADVHMGLGRRAAALPEVARRAGGGDIVPGRAATLGAGQNMVEGQLARIAAILAGEAVAQEQVEPGEGRIFGRADIL